MEFFFGLLLALLIALFGVCATVWLAVRTWKHTSVGGKALAAVITCATIYAALVTVVGLVKAAGALGGESVDPSQKARVLAEGISEVMNCTAFGLAVWIPGSIAMFVLTRKAESTPPGATAG